MLTPKQERVEAFKRYKATVKSWDRYGRARGDRIKKEEQALFKFVQELKAASEFFYMVYKRLEEKEQSDKKAKRILRVKKHIPTRGSV